MNQYFSLFQLPTRFPMDNAALEERYRALAAQCHPDKFAAANAFEQKQAMMMATTVNEAYRTLKDPLNRAAYLLSLNGIEADAPEHTRFDEAFLMQQMEWRETLEAGACSADEGLLDHLAAEIHAAQTALLQRLEAAFAQNDEQEAANLVRQGRFYGKMLEQIRQIHP